MHKTNPKTILFFLLKSPGRAKELVRKFALRFFDTKNSLAEEKYEKWMADHNIDFAKYAESIDPQTWSEANQFSANLQARGQEMLKDLPDLGGGGIYPLLYFIVRKMKPDVVVETGVAAGFSSQSFLKALQKNGKGKLYSSDFPIFRLADPEKYIGTMVEPELKSNWALYTEGDQENLPKIVSTVDKIDIFHYDSDKTYKGRIFAYNLVKNKMSPYGLIIWDDIHNNTHFYDHVIQNNITDYKVFKFERKYVGMLGNLSMLENKVTTYSGATP